MISSSTSFIIFLVASFATVSAFAVASAGLDTRDGKPPAFFLAGDSTTATQSKGGGGKKHHLQIPYLTPLTEIQPGGWGDGFIKTCLKNGATGLNLGHNGRTTLDFRSGGDWSWVLGNASKAAGSYQPYVTIQFGHNDQKKEGITIPQFTANLEQFVKDVEGAKGIPILVTPLSRRHFVNGKIEQDLTDMAAATVDAATKSGAKYIDLQGASQKYLDAIGEEKGQTYALKTTMDHTHLNSEGSEVFGNMVAMLLNEALPELKAYVVPEQDIADAISQGKYIYPSCTGDFC